LVEPGLLAGIKRDLLAPEVVEEMRRRPDTLFSPVCG
jgi:hypothetical protein